MSEEAKAPEAPKRHQALDALGISDEQFQAWKAAYRKLGVAKFSDQWFLYRPLMRKEMRDLSAVEGGKAFDLEEKISCRCLLAPKLGELELRGCTAGLASSLSQDIMELSDYSPASPPERI